MSNVKLAQRDLVPLARLRERAGEREAVMAQHRVIILGGYHDR